MKTDLAILTDGEQLIETDVAPLVFTQVVNNRKFRSPLCQQSRTVVVIVGRDSDPKVNPSTGTYNAYLNRMLREIGGITEGYA